jgi:hypothetical protein
VKIKLGQELAHLLGAPHQQWQDPTLETLLQPAQPRPSKLDSAGHHRQPPHLAVPIAISLERIHCDPALRLAPAQELNHFLFEQILNPVRNPAPGELLQRRPLCALRCFPA